MKLRFDNTLLTIPLSRWLRVLLPENIAAWAKSWGTIPVREWVLGAEAFKRGDFREAALFYRNGLARVSNHPAREAARFDLAFSLAQLGKTREAAEELQGSKLAEARFLRITLLERLGENPVEELRQLTLRYPAEKRYRLEWLRLVIDPPVGAAAQPLTDGEFDFIQDELERIAKRIDINDPEHSWLLYLQALLEVRYGDSDLGETLLSHSLASGVAPVHAKLLRAELWIAARRITPAQELLRRVLRVDSQEVRAMNLLAECYLFTEEGEFAQQLARLACTHSEYQHNRSLELLAASYELCGETNGAELVLNRYLERTTPSVDLQVVRAVEKKLELLRS